MTYFLDFDRTIFDFDAFFLEFVEEPKLAHLKDRLIDIGRIPRGVDPAHDQKRNAMWEEIHGLFVGGIFSFPEDSLSKFVFPDARAFLEGRGRGSVIVTKGGVQLAFQKGKVEASKIMELISHCEYVLRDTPKGEAVKKLLGTYPGPYSFIDDFPNELNSVAGLCPEVSLFEIRRDGKPGSGEYPVIRSFDELP